MPWRGPEYPGEFPSLGWALVDLIEAYLRVPSGKAYGQPLRMTDRQIAGTVRAHRIDPDTGRYVYRRWVREGPKGDGKSPHLGAMAFAHLVGPIVFDGWDAAGEPVGRPHPTPWIQIAALAEDQTDNCYMQLRASLGQSPAIDEFGIDLGLTRIFLRGRPGKIEPVTSSSGTREGQPITFAGKEEVQYWTPPKSGPQLSRTLDRNLVKTGGLSMAVTNAYRKGEDSVAETEAAAARKGAAGLLYEAARAPWVEDLLDRELVMRALRTVYDPQADWINLEDIADACADETVPAGERRRFYLNIPDAFSEQSWLPDGEWEKHREEGARVDRSRPFSAGVDVALKRDTTALRLAQRRPDGTLVTEAQVWTPENGEHLDLMAVEQAIRVLHRTGNLSACAYDPAYFERSAQVLEDEGVAMLEFPQTHQRMVPACGHAFEMILAGQVVHDDDPVSAAQVTAAVPKVAGEAWRLSKGRTKAKIDSAIAMVMAVDVETTRPEPPPVRRSWGVLVV
jgi:hypothetical protein